MLPYPTHTHTQYQFYLWFRKASVPDNNSCRRLLISPPVKEYLFPKKRIEFVGLKTFWEQLRPGLCSVFHYKQIVFGQLRWTRCIFLGEKICDVLFVCSIWKRLYQNFNKCLYPCGMEMWPVGRCSVCFPVDRAAVQESSLRLLHTRLEDGGRRSGRWRVSTQFHDGFREEASQAFQVAEQWEGRSVEESR